MPRRSSARPAPRPAARPAAPAAQQTRPASTAAYPARPAAAPAPTPAPAAAVPATAAPASSGGGMLASIASTAAGVGIGHVVGHGLVSMFSGSSAPSAPVEAAAAPVDQAQQSNWQTPSCEADAKNFTKCLDDNQGNMQICSWYLEQLKACQNMAKNL
ncbi:hypothetical protein EX30DRAFT_398085 [Ascodesmis nigricans]|uniref:CHCH domain-containing protein n=1 Tax=Ascodesmis nigricans TaxID=341454 RepID=A0A4S2MLZ2_9PEZI|nr:hypothetical protein EX30DRAFT_398085 [Ascodesmis nigricans]